MGAWEGRCTQSLLGFVRQFPFWYAKYEGCLISSSSHRSNPVTTLPPPMNSFTWIQKVKLHNLASSNEKQVCSTRWVKVFIHNKKSKVKKV